MKFETSWFYIYVVSKRFYLEIGSIGKPTSILARVLL